MIPHIETSFGDIPTFPICVALGVVLMLLLTSRSLRKLGDYIAEENYIFPKLVICGIFGYFASGLFDSLVKIPIYGEFRVTGITFYGGFIGAVISLFVLLKATKNRTGYSVREWFDLLTHPFIAFHILGRIGCFCGGCCYGKATDSFLGIVFPDNASAGILHNGVKRYPTQLFEAVALIVIFHLLLKSKNKFVNYVLLYAAARFIIEFFRGDERGSISSLFSPSQIVSIILFAVVISSKCIAALRKFRHPKDS